MNLSKHGYIHKTVNHSVEQCWNCMHGILLVTVFMTPVYLNKNVFFESIFGLTETDLLKCNVLQ